MNKVQIIYLTPKKQDIVDMNFESGDTVEDVILKSGILDRNNEISLVDNKFGIWGKLIDLKTTVCPEDRIEIYRKLMFDPKEVRRRRAARK